MSKELIARIEEQWAGLDPVDPLRLLLKDVVDVLAAPVQKPPVFAELLCVCGAEWAWRNRDWELMSTPPAAQRGEELAKLGWQAIECPGCGQTARGFPRPAQRQPLTDERLLEIIVRLDPETKRLPPGFRLFTRAIEAAHDIK